MKVLMFSGTILLWILAFVINTGKANFLIAGYNTASDEEKEKIDGMALAKFMGKLLFVLGIILLPLPIVTILELSNSGVIITCTGIIFSIVCIGAVIYSNTGERFKKKK